MITDYLKAGFPTILLQTQEPHRADELMRRIPEWQMRCRVRTSVFAFWDRAILTSS